MTERQRDMKDLLRAFFKSKREPTKENLDAFVEVVERVNLDKVLMPVLEVAYEAIDQYALNMGQRSDDVIDDMQRIPALN